MSEIQRGVRRYLAFVMRDHGLSATALAKEAGIAASTLTRFLNDGSYKFTLSNTTLEKIAKAVDLSPAPFLKDEDLATLGLHVTGQSEITESLDSDIMITIGDVAPGVWIEDSSGEDFTQAIHSLRLSFFKAGETFACRVRGRAINDLAQDGEFLLCVKTESYLKKANPGDEQYVVAQTEREGGLLELTARLAQRVDDKVILRAVQYAPGRKAKIVVLTGYDDRSQATRIIGFVEAIVRYPNTRSFLSAPSLGPSDD